jgi:catechol 2,3-dioxygenase-like lactoylglutathione lyase family enzyme
VIKDVAFFCYPVASIPASRRFYEEVLGLKLEHNFQDQWLEYDINGSTLAITTKDNEHTPGLTGGIIAFEVDDLDASVARLREGHASLPLRGHHRPGRQRDHHPQTQGLSVAAGCSLRPHAYPFLSLCPRSEHA